MKTAPENIANVCGINCKIVGYYWRHESEIRYEPSQLPLFISSVIGEDVTQNIVETVVPKPQNNISYLMKNGMKPHIIMDNRQGYYNLYHRLKASTDKCETIWVDFPAEMGLSKYMISPCGKIWSKTDQKVMSIPVKPSGYRIAKLYPDSKTGAERWILSVLLAIVFIPNDDPENKTTVDHIDRDRDNNDLRNLRWATKSEQSYNRCKDKGGIKRPVNLYDLDGNVISSFSSLKEASDKCNVTANTIRYHCLLSTIWNLKYTWRYADIQKLPEEEWKPVLYVPEFEGFFYSNEGRIMRPSGSITSGYLHIDGYYQITSNEKRMRVSRLICISEYGLPTDDRFLVNHKDGCKTNNRPKNLELVTYSQNSQHAHDTGLNRVAKISRKQNSAILQIDLDGKIIKRYNNTLEVLQDNYSRDGIFNSLTNYNVITAGYRWIYESNYYKNEFNSSSDYLEFY